MRQAPTPEPPPPARSSVVDGPLRVLDITKFFAPRSGGVRTYLQAKIRDFAGRDIEHTLVVPADRAGSEIRGRTRIYRLPGPAIPLTTGYRLLVSAGALRRIVERERPQVIEVGSPFLVPPLVRRATAGMAVRTVGFYHSDLIRTYGEPYVTARHAAGLRVLGRIAARRFVRHVYRRFDATVAASAAVVDELRSLGVPRVRCIPLGVDLELFAPAAAPAGSLGQRVGARPGAAVGLFVGRLCAEKRLDVVLEAHRRIPAASRPHLVLVGDGRQRAWLAAEAGRREGLTVLPFESDRAALARTYAGADFYVAPGPGETFGLSIAEAMASGLPVIAVDSGAAPDRIAGTRAGRVYHHGDVESCRAALEWIATAAPALRAEARACACRSFGWSATFDALVALYRALAAGSTA